MNPEAVADREIIRLTGISKSYSKLRVLENLDLATYRGEFVSILGESGSGKSTLLNIIGLLDSCDSGEYFFNGKRVSRKHYPRFRNHHIGFVFQLYYLIPSMSARQNIMLPLLYSKERVSVQIERIAEELGLSELLNKRSDELSGGEKQRVAIARAIVLQPDLIIADEPTGALDEKNALLVLDLFRKYSRNGKSVIMVTHNRSYAANADRQYTLMNGALHENEIQ